MLLLFRSFGDTLVPINFQDSKSDVESVKDENKTVESATTVVGFGGLEVHLPLPLLPLHHSHHS